MCSGLTTRVEPSQAGTGLWRPRRKNSTERGPLGAPHRARDGGCRLGQVGERPPKLALGWPREQALIDECARTRSHCLGSMRVRLCCTGPARSSAAMCGAIDDGAGGRSTCLLKDSSRLGTDQVALSVGRQRWADATLAGRSRRSRCAPGTRCRRRRASSEDDPRLIGAAACRGPRSGRNADPVAATW